MERKLFKWKRVAIDFDGTLVESVGHTEHNTDWHFENNVMLNALPGAADTTQWLQDQGFEVLIYTCRPDYHRQYMEKILADNYISYDYILFYTKPLVDLYIDDKGFRFSDWQTTQDWLERNLNAPLNKTDHIGMEPQNIFEDLLRKERVRVLLGKKYGKILDIGCGSGKLWELCDKSLRPEMLCGVEPNKILLDMARKTKLFNTVMSQDGIYDIEKFDLVTLFGVLEHVDSPISLLERYSSINEIVGTVPNANSFHRKIGKCAGMIDEINELGPQDIAVGHKKVYRYHEMFNVVSEFATKNNFKISKFGTLGFKFTNGEEMMQFADRWEAINEAASDIGLIGDHSTRGAEIYFHLEKA